MEHLEKAKMYMITAFLMIQTQMNGIILLLKTLVFTGSFQTLMSASFSTFMQLNLVKNQIHFQK
jgi:hypothetical protein